MANFLNSVVPGIYGTTSKTKAMANSYKEQGDKMIDWAKKVKCPKEVQLTAQERVVNVPLFLQTNVGTMQAYEPGNRIWLLAYMRIYRLKEVLINNKKAKAL